MRLEAGVLVDVLGLVDKGFGPARGQEIGLLDEIEERVLRPFGIAEAVVLGVGHGDRLRLVALQALEGADPQAQEVGREPALRLDRLLRVAQHVLGHLAEGLDDIADLVGKARIGAAFLGRLQIGGRRLAGLLDEAGHVARQGLEIRQGQVRRVVAVRLLHETSRTPQHAAVFSTR